MSSTCCSKGGGELAVLYGIRSISGTKRYNVSAFHCTGPIVFPASLKQYVTESALQKAFLQCLILQRFAPILRHWPPARSASKTAIGTFYLWIDVTFQSKRMSSRSDNIYSFVQRVVHDSRKSPLEAMHYGTDNTAQQLISIVSGHHNDLEVMTEKVTEQQKN